MSEEHQNSPRFHVIRGLLIPATKPYKRKYVEDAMDYMPGDGDLIIASYPRTGTTWMQYICFQIKSKGQHFPFFDDVKYKLVPNIELNGVAAINAQTKPRFYTHHLPYDKVQKNSKSKTIYIYRHPEDTLVSFYHYLKDLNFPECRWEFNQFVDAFVTGHAPFGSCFKHVLSFYEHREDANLLMVSYENLQANTKEEVLRIAKFLGEEYYECLIEDEQLFNELLEHTSFDYMKNNLVVTHPDIRANTKENPSEGKTPDVYFFRKGIVGDGKAVLSENQRQRCKAAAEEVLKGTSILDEWYSK